MEIKLYGMDWGIIVTEEEKVTLDSVISLKAKWTWVVFFTFTVNGIYGSTEYNYLIKACVTQSCL